MKRVIAIAVLGCGLWVAGLAFAEGPASQPAYSKIDVHKTGASRVGLIAYAQDPNTFVGKRVVVNGLIAAVAVDGNSATVTINWHIAGRPARESGQAKGDKKLRWVTSKAVTTAANAANFPQGQFIEAWMVVASAEVVNINAMYDEVVVHGSSLALP